ncbi:MAG: cupin domain-containing protein [Chloroflexi bacterium]|nr:cupin domain-containing protein [Chloroflexota bacterium]
MRKLFLVAVALVPLLAAPPSASAEWDVADQALLKAVRARFEGLTPGQVVQAGYRADSSCVGTPFGMMGFHAQKDPFNNDNLVGAWDPEILLLDQNGAVKGIEYETWDTKVARPRLFGLDFSLSPGHPGREWPHYMLHIHFRPGNQYLVGDFNPDRRCPGLEAQVGVPPVSGWRWALAELKTGAEPRAAGPHDHAEPWLFYAVEGSSELIVEGQRIVMAAGEGRWVPARQEHSHAYPAQSRLLLLRLAAADHPVGQLHGGASLFAPDDTLEAAPGVNHVLRVEERLLPAGAHLPERPPLEPTIAYVVAGALTSEVGGVERRVEAGQTTAWTARDGSVEHSAGPGVTRFMTLRLGAQR